MARQKHHPTQKGVAKGLRWFRVKGGGGACPFFPVRLGVSVWVSCKFRQFICLNFRLSLKKIATTGVYGKKIAWDIKDIKDTPS